MKEIAEEIEEIALRCKRIALKSRSAALLSLGRKLDRACEEVGEAWSGSWIGYHAYTYVEGLRPRQADERWDPEWGSMRRFSSQTTGPWREYKYNEVRQEILRRAGSPKLDAIVQAAKAAEVVFEKSRGKLAPALDALLDASDSSTLREQKNRIKELQSHVSASDVVQEQIPRNFMSRDSLAMSQGIKVPHHIGFQAWLAEQFSHGQQLEELARIAEHVAKYLHEVQRTRGETVPTPGGHVFIGHGHSPVWRELKDFVHDRLKLDWDEFKRVATPGLSNKERLKAMLESACFALIVFTGEDEHLDGSRHARESVIHEAGLFQGRLGFESDHNAGGRMRGFLEHPRSSTDQVPEGEDLRRLRRG